MAEQQYEERFNYQSLIFILINKFNIAIEEKRETGTRQITVLLKEIPNELKKDITPTIDEINTQYDALKQKLLDEWTIQIGHPSNNKFTNNITSDRQAKLDELRTMANLDIIQTIINMMYKKRMLLTDTNTMPSSLVR